jgi:predicted PurR-regulated permease PerM
MTNKLTSTILRTLFAIALICALLLLIWKVRFTIIYILIAAILALIGKPLVDVLSGDKYKKVNLNRGASAAITLLLMVTILGGVLSVFIPSLLAELEVLSTIDVEALFEEVELGIINLRESITGQEMEVESSKDLIKGTVERIFNFENISNTFESLLSGLGNLMFALFSILFMTFFFMREVHLFRNIILALVPDNYEAKVLRIAPRMKNTLSRYFIGLLMQVTIVTSLVSIGLSAIGFENTIVIGFFAGLLNLIPYIGPIIGMAFGLILGLSQSIAGEFSASYPTLALLIICVFAGIQMIDNFLLQPIIFSNSINAHPLEIFIVISVAATISGISGMIVAVPVYSVLRLVAAEFFPQVKLVRKLTANLQLHDKK